MSLNQFETDAVSWILANWKKALASHAAFAVGGYALHMLLRWPF